jgi:oligoendopeptidase F
MPIALPARTPADFAEATWADILPLYRSLAERALDASGVPAWLTDWSRLEELLTEAAALAMIGYTCDTGDPVKEARYLRFSADILPRADEQGVLLAGRLLESGYTTPDLEVPIHRFRAHIDLFREANIPLTTAAEELGARYQKLTGGLTVQWDGAEKTIPQLQPFLESTDRAVRERAFRLGTDAYADRRDELADIFDSLFALRSRIASNAGFADFEAYSFRARLRIDYTPADCRRFHQAVEAVVAPAVERLMERRRQRLGVATLRPWDLGVDPGGREPLRPFREVPAMVDSSAAMFDRLSPRLGRDFRTMLSERLLDLDSRKGKAPGGYCESLHHRGRPFIFMNAVGVLADLWTLLHESGHAFHVFLARAQPLIWQRHPSLEMCELASMSMELLAARYLQRGEGGPLDREAYARARAEHFEDVLLTLSHVASVDAFQSWLYTSGEGHDRDARDAAWVRLRDRFERGVDWSGLERERVARWYRQLHIFLHPFYYIEYGLAQLGALQVWRNSLADEALAVGRYCEALALGATRRLPELYRTAGAELTFDVSLMGDLVRLVEQEIQRFD